jgi:hypothetical protein
MLGNSISAATWMFSGKEKTELTTFSCRRPSPFPASTTAMIALHPVAFVIASALAGQGVRKGSLSPSGGQFRDTSYCRTYQRVQPAHDLSACLCSLAVAALVSGCMCTVLCRLLYNHPPNSVHTLPDLSMANDEKVRYHRDQSSPLVVILTFFCLIAVLLEGVRGHHDRLLSHRISRCVTHRPVAVSRSH